MPVTRSKEDLLNDRWKRLGIHPSDVREHFVRSGGKGGQNVNKVSTCVALKHLPTGIEVKCQETRSQAMNRFLARRILADKIERQILGKQSAIEKRIYVIRKQKQKRSKRAKEKLLADKRVQARKKELRKTPRVTDN